jgi:hypothetical protein
VEGEAVLERQGGVERLVRVEGPALADGAGPMGAVEATVGAAGDSVDRHVEAQAKDLTLVGNRDLAPELARGFLILSP